MTRKQNNMPETSNSQTTEPVNALNRAEHSAEPNNFNGWLKLIAVLTAILLIGLLIWSLSHSSKSKPAQAHQTAQISVTASGLMPTTVQISPGTIVVWTNLDKKPHQIAADPYPLDNSIPGFISSVVLQKKDSINFSFNRTGTYTYHDERNPLNRHFQGIIIVK